MKQLFRFTLVMIMAVFANNAMAQITKVPQAAKDNFEKQYPNAENAKWYNDIISATVLFEINGESMNAEYNNKGIWKSTEKTITYEKLPAAVIDGFKKSKYADRTVSETKIIYYPGNVMQYRIKAEKNDVEKKYVFFDETGRLVRDAFTL
jgi:Putative beta-lactamase-inhibitor-like, PepSY-like